MSNTAPDYPEIERAEGFHPKDTHRIRVPESGFVYDFPSEEDARTFARDAGLDVEPEEIP